MLDLKSAAPAARRWLKLVDTADVLMHSIRPQKLAAIGLDPQTLRTRNPRLVYAGPARLRRGRPLRRHARLRRHHPGPVGLRRR